MDPSGKSTPTNLDLPAMFEDDFSPTNREVRLIFAEGYHFNVSFSLAYSLKESK